MYARRVDPAAAIGVPAGDVADDAGPVGTAEVDDSERAVADASSAGRGGRLALGVALLVLLAAPLLVALGVLANPRWFPLLDMAQTELRVRDIASSHPPLIGLAGRIGTFGIDSGSHPGPLSFWSLWPFYQLFGATSWALQAAGVMLNLIAIGCALWIAHRRAGTTLMLAVGALIAILTHAYTTDLLTLPWNPYLPVLWWIVFLLAVWSVFLGDLPMLPVAVFAGTFCAQTHIPYLGLVGGLIAITAGIVIWRAFDSRAEAEARRANRRWGLIGVATGVLLWLPPVIEEFVHSPGNLTVMWRHFSNPPEEAVGVGSGVRDLLTQLNVWRLFTDELASNAGPAEVGGSIVPGLLLISAGLITAFVSWRLRHRALVALHTVIGIALALGFVSASRIFGKVWYYLLLWAWGIAALLVLAVGWTLVVAVRARVPAARTERATRGGQFALAGIALVVVVWTVTDATRTTVQTPRVNDALGAVIPSTAAALRDAAARGDDGPYLVTFQPDPLGIGAQGYGLLNELDRLGFDVRVHELNRAGATRYHAMEPEDARLELHVATGREIERWRAQPGFTEIAYVDPRPIEEITEYERLREQVFADLANAGQEDLMARVDDALLMQGLNESIAPETRRRLDRMLEIGLPTAVFMGPPSGAS